MSQTILVVDDEESIVKLVQYTLGKAGYEVVSAADSDAAMSVLQQQPVDLIILDLMLPGMDGFEICKRLRAEGNDTPIIMLTARDDEVDRVLGLEFGADDYVTKPFSPRELSARVKAVLRRIPAPTAGTQETALIQVGDIKLDSARHEVTKAGDRIDLTALEFHLLQCMMSHQNHVLSRQQLLDFVWSYDFPGDTRIVDVHIAHLRDKLENDPKRPEYIRTVRGVGYKFAWEGSD